MPVLVMTGYEKQRARAVIAAGANGFLNKEEKKDRVLEAVKWIVRGDGSVWLSPSAAVEWMQTTNAIEKARLTKTELRVLELIELPNSVIAERLFVSQGTVKNHVSTIYSKLNVTRRQGTIAWANKHGLLLTRVGRE